MEKEFLELIGPHQAIIHKICRLYRHTPEDREDLFQEVVYQLWKAFPQFKGNASVSTWMYRIALNTALATFRKQRPVVNYTDTLPDMAEGAENPQAEQEERLFQALSGLSDVEKALVSLYLDDFSYRALADVLGISESNVGVRLNRIKAKLKQTLTI
ncbi:RNA polymerase sigma factor [Botryobacter ruber]|uniref:RNA polymerase sigma factor n=1 Tax=Botryobacter ruber TaxID=2171629 RepID=UPI000E0B652B|nr:sigma-70 family RNA polymerase sigma factor [Botryobacter ruber]